MRARKVHKLKQTIRALNYHQRIELMDWLNMWYESYKEEQQMLYDEYMREWEEE